MGALLPRFWLLILCAALAVSPNTSARDDLPRLAPQVDIDTLAALVTLAARDRLCTQTSQGTFSALNVYRTCMAAQPQLNSCTVSRSDLAQLRGLMASDSRLPAIASFESVIAHIASSCATALDAYGANIPPTALPARCTLETPLLTAHAIILNIPAPSTDERIEQRATCNSTLGKLYLSEHCLRWARPLGRPIEVLRQQRPKYLDYFCPLKLQR